MRRCWNNDRSELILVGYRASARGLPLSGMGPSFGGTCPLGELREDSQWLEGVEGQ